MLEDIHLSVGWLLPTVLPVMRLMLNILLRSSYPSDFPSPARLHSQYDFIVVGGGTAGSVMAARLSEVPEWNVLLLEAGGKPTPETRVPGLSRVFYFEGGPTWDDFHLAPQRIGLRNFVNRSSPVPQGKVLGGSSAVNGMLYVRGNRRDFDNWSSLGNQGWDYLSVLPYFKKAEGYRGPPLSDTESYHGREGPLPVTPDRDRHKPFTSAFLRAGQYLGFSVIDPNGPEQIGFSGVDYTIKDGERWSTAQAYLHPASRRPNLHIVTGATVLQILFDNQKRAVGVVYKHKGKIETCNARREVVLSAGALLSPKLLMLSGVGPTYHLHQHGVKVVSDLPGVGQNLQDHLCVYGITWNVKRGLPTASGNAISPQAIKDYVGRRAGAYATPLGEFGHGWTHMGGDGDPNWPDVQLFMVSSSLAQEGLLSPHALGLSTKVYLEHYRPLFGRPGMSILTYIMRPKSRGSVTLRSGHALDPPVVDPNYFSHPDDLRTLVNGIKTAVQLGRTPPFVKTLGAKLYTKPLQECEGHKFGSDAYWACYVLHMSSTFYHFAGTCKMGPTSDPYSVVDENLKVRGVSGLRVVDASVMPVVVTGNTMATVIMIAERAADLIKQDWLSSPNSYEYNTT